MEAALGVLYFTVFVVSLVGSIMVARKVRKAKDRFDLRRREQRIEAARRLEEAKAEYQASVARRIASEQRYGQ